ncbi:hypothetical protein DY000_02021822 [Brassica cretica]|uniref:Uncharacterized protein n=1 Tax=Brassica cretica TaxID=69181 RepID=A0ABQ7EEI4_BRACR|nr:hypothetical protein DY000_02021822 [Brassica cretica]
MPSSTRSNKETHLLFSEDPAYSEHSIRKDQRSTSLDAAAFTSTDSLTHPSTNTRPSSSTDLHRSTSIVSTLRTLIDHQSRSVVAIVILRQDENENLYDQDVHLTWSLRSDRALARARSLRSDQALARARLLRSDRAEHAFGCCIATLFELLYDDSRFFRKAFRKEESISIKYLSKKVSTFSSLEILTLTSLQPFSTPTVSPPAR